MVCIPRSRPARSKTFQLSSRPLGKDSHRSARGFGGPLRAVAMRVWAAFLDDPEPAATTRILVFAVALIVVGLLNFIPFVGWVANYSLVLLGIGAITNATFNYMIGNPGMALDVDMKLKES